jgi:N-methylhydantoinase A
MAPTSAGALSAIGVLAADVIKDQGRTVMLRCRPSEVARLAQTFKEMEGEARSVLRTEGFANNRQKHDRSLAMRYLGQSFDLEIQKTTGDIAATFHEAHRDRYGYAQESCEIEIVSARLRSSGLVEKLPEAPIAVSLHKRFVPPPEYVSAYFEGKKVKVGVYRRGELQGGVKLRVPCIVTEYSATTLIPPGASASLDLLGNLLIEVYESD